MKPLPTTRQCLVLLCICPADESTPQPEKNAHRLFARAIMILLLCGFASSLTFCWKFNSIDLGKAFFSFLITAGQFAALYTICVATFLMRHKIDAIFDGLSTIYKDGKFSKQADEFHLILLLRVFCSITIEFTAETDGSSRFLARANNFSEWIWKIYINIWVAAIIIHTFFVPSTSIAYSWVHNRNLNVTNFYHPIPFV